MGKPKKLFIGLPVHESIDPQFALCLVKVAAEISNINAILYPHCGDSLVCRARNSITRHFLNSDATHLLMIDSDLVFSCDHISRIFSHDLDIVGGCYVKKQEGDPCLVANSLPGQPDVKEELDKDGTMKVSLVKVKYIGTGFICIKREVFERMIEKFGEDMWYKLDHDEKTIENDFWRAAPYQYKDGHRRYLSEDWWFCQRAMDCGMDIWMDLKILLKHSGAACYPLSYQEAKLFGNPTQPAKPDNCGGDAAAPIVSDPPLSFNRETKPVEATA